METMMNRILFAAGVTAVLAFGATSAMAQDVGGPMMQTPGYADGAQAPAGAGYGAPNQPYYGPQGGSPMYEGRSAFIGDGYNSAPAMNEPSVQYTNGNGGRSENYENGSGPSDPFSAQEIRAGR
jgi:hypothetical protein